MFKLLKINIILALPKMWEEVLLKDVFEYHGGKGLFVK
jgi:hypothetical protein